MTSWHTALELNADRRLVGGSASALRSAIQRGADLRIYTEFIFNEHVDVTSSDSQRVQEVSEFGVTYCVDRSWTAGVMSLRQPIEVPTGFGTEPSMSFFLYNEDGAQAIARPHFTGIASGTPGPSMAVSPAGMAKYRTTESADSETNAPSSNFVYRFDTYRFCVGDHWQEVLAHDANGQVMSGSMTELTAAFAEGREMKIGVSGLCDDLADPQLPVLPHEVFVRVGPGYFLVADNAFCAGSHPLVRIRPAIPMAYRSRGWDFGWLMVRTDGQLTYRRCDPYSLGFSDHPMRCAIRWFVR